jgi:flagellin FlaB
MYTGFRGTLKKLHRNQKGITGLETAIILIAFVTVAAVLAYSVLSAGLFSAERGTETVYEGLEQAQATMKTKGSVIATTINGTQVDTIVFQVGSVLNGQGTDMTAGASATTTIRLVTDNMTSNDCAWSTTLLTVERGGVNVLEDDEVMEVTVTIPAGHQVGAYKKSTIQLVPQKGAPLTIARTLPAAMYTVNDLN